MKRITSIAGLLIVIAASGAFIASELQTKGTSQTAVAPASTSVSNSSGTTANGTVAKVGIQAVKPLTGAAALALTNGKEITWETMGFPPNQGVDINLIKKTKNSPASYVFVRKIATNTANDGSEDWAPNANETGSDFYIEVTCSSSASGSCQVAGGPLRAN